MTCTSSARRLRSGAPVPPPEAIAPQMWRISEDGADASRPLMPPHPGSAPARSVLAVSEAFRSYPAPVVHAGICRAQVVTHAPGGLVTDPVALPPGDVPCSDTCVLPPGGVSCPGTCVLHPSDVRRFRIRPPRPTRRRLLRLRRPSTPGYWRRCNDPHPRCSQLRTQRNDGCSDPAVLRARLRRRCNDPHPRCSQLRTQTKRRCSAPRRPSRPALATLQRPTPPRSQLRAGLQQRSNDPHPSGSQLRTLG